MLSTIADHSVRDLRCPVKVRTSWHGPPQVLRTRSRPGPCGRFGEPSFRGAEVRTARGAPGRALVTGAEEPGSGSANATTLSLGVPPKNPPPPPALIATYCLPFFP